MLNRFARNVVWMLPFFATTGALAQDSARDTPELHRLSEQTAPWVSPTLQLQSWFTAWDQDENPQADAGGYGDPEHDTGFTIPRARIGLGGAYKMVSFRLLAGTSRAVDALQDDPAPFELVAGWVRTTFDTGSGSVILTLGSHQAPFSREMQISSNDLIFQERSVSTNWLAINRDLGFSARYAYKWFSLAGGVYNGGGNLWGDDDPGLRVAARADVHIGGDTYRTNASDSAFGFGAAYMFDKRFTTTTQRVGVDMLARYKGLTLLAEATLNRLDPDDTPVILPPDVPEVTQRLGGFAQVSYYRELPLGAIEPAVRFSYLDDATHLQDNGDVGILHGGVSWREPIPFVDIGAGYIHRMEFQGAAVDNDSVRAWVGFQYPSRKHQPLDLMTMVRAATTPGGKGTWRPSCENGSCETPCEDKGQPCKDGSCETPCEDGSSSSQEVNSDPVRGKKGRKNGRIE
ncbi:MAG: porin [Myxococcota bacterium]